MSGHDERPTSLGFILTLIVCSVAGFFTGTYYQHAQEPNLITIKTCADVIVQHCSCDFEESDPIPAQTPEGLRI